MATVRIKRPKAPSKESRKGLIKKTPAKKEEPFKFLGSLDRKNGEIALVRIVGFLKGESHTLFSKAVFTGKESLMKKIHDKYNIKYDSIEATLIMKWDKYGRKVE